MGCDIHAIIEGTIGTNWYGIIEVPIDRNYHLFSLLADVRNEEYDQPGWVQPLSLPKGIPNNISHTAKDLFDELGEDGHNHSWLSWHELQRLEEKFKQLPFFRIMQIYNEDEKYFDLRLVFCFDN